MFQKILDKKVIDIHKKSIMNVYSIKSNKANFFPYLCVHLFL